MNITVEEILRSFRELAVRGAVLHRDTFERVCDRIVMDARDRERASRWLLALRYRRDFGLTYREVGRLMSVSHTRAASMCRNAERLLKRASLE